MSLFWSVPKSNLKVFLSPLNHLGLIPCALVGFPFVENRTNENYWQAINKVQPTEKAIKL